MTDGTGAVGDLCRAVSDLIYPPKCVVCGELQPRYFCDHCRKSIEITGEDICRTCGAPSIDEICHQCIEEPPPFEIARAVGMYQGVLREAIHAFKYEGKTAVADELAEMMIEFASARERLMRDVDIVLPVPIHRSRERSRGFNQAELLAARIADALGLPMLRGVLIRARKTRSQVELSPTERRTNVRGAFQVTRPELIANRIVLLVDDVLTTGSTAAEAANTLLAAGALEIRVLTLARD